MVTQEIVAQTSGSGLPIDLNNPTVNRRRERRIYYREHFDKDHNSLGWHPTLPLPSDMWHMQYYAQKGFRLSPPTITARAEAPAGEAPKVAQLAPSQPNGIACPVEGCTKIVKSYIGLARHMSKAHALK